MRIRTHGTCRDARRADTATTRGPLGPSSSRRGGEPPTDRERGAGQALAGWVGAGGRGADRRCRQATKKRADPCVKKLEPTRALKSYKLAHRFRSLASASCRRSLASRLHGRRDAAAVEARSRPPAHAAERPEGAEARRRAVAGRVGQDLGAQRGDGHGAQESGGQVSYYSIQ